MKVIWIYCKNVDKRTAVNQAAKLIKAQVKELALQDLTKTVGTIIGMPNKGAGSRVKSNDKSNTNAKPNINNNKNIQVPPFFMMPELLLFSGINSADMDSFLDAYKKASVAPISLKAMVTPYNVSFTLYELVCELNREQKALDKNRK